MNLIKTFVFILCSFTAVANAADYYVATDGNDNNPGTEQSPWRNISEANANLTPGDTVFIRAGEYQEVIQPSQSGTSDTQRITYKAYPGEAPVITNSPGANAVVLLDKSYITISGLTIDGKGEFTDSNLDRWANLNNAHNNVFENNIMKQAKGYHCFRITNSNNNALINNTIDLCGTNDPAKFGSTAQEGNGDSVFLECGTGNSLQGNTLTRAGHNLLSLNGRENVIKNNTFNNTWTTEFGYRNMSVTTKCTTITGYNLLEGNIFTGTKKALIGIQTPKALKLEGVGHIFRRNFVYDNDFVSIGGGVRNELTGGGRGMTKVKVYNNVFYDNGYLYSFFDRGEIALLGTGSNIFKNNISYLNSNYRLIDVGIAANAANDGNNPLNEDKYINNVFKRDSGTTSFGISYAGIGVNVLSWWESNYPNNFSGNLQVIPDFVSANPAVPEDFMLQENSPLIDAGANLTVTTSASSGTNVSVQNAGYFSDGNGVQDGDLVVIGSNVPVRVTNVNYDTNVLTLESSITWSNGDEVNLSYNGTAPDIGAFEMGDDPTPIAPPGPGTIISIVINETPTDPVIFSEDFNDGVANDFVVQSGSWIVQDGRYRVETAVWPTVSTIEVALPQAVNMEVTANLEEGVAPASNAFIVFDYQSNTDFKFAGGLDGTNQWIIGRYTGSRLKDVIVSEQIVAGVDYVLDVAIDGNTVTFSVDGVIKATNTYPDSLTDGRLGLATFNAITAFDDVLVQGPNL